ncbi:MFS transporter [uncultured Agrococcus sp.]|uniref:MFS transporter n=1 Tax=uncultured Agrococcus sp. TaxID=382258 RepID=UPI0025FBF235|nr:MFS transporter [uncultured Agrococcus sp.]
MNHAPDWSTMVDVAQTENAKKKPQMVRTAVVVGTALEHYDFFIYGTAAALVFNQQYFASEDPLVSSLAAFATFAVGFIARPLGAVFFGHLGDTIGRRNTLIITLVVIGISTGLIGIVPTFAAIGIWAPIALVVLRFLQGLSFGGEWAGAVTLATEHAPPGKKGLYASLPQLGSPIGNITSSGAFLLLAFMPAETFDAWGWRIPFLLAFPLLGVALWVRTLVDESPEFKKVAAKDQVKKVPALEVLKHSPGRMMTAAALALVTIGGFFLVTTFAISYGTNTVGLPSNVMLTATMSAAILQIVTVLVTGYFSDSVNPVKLAVWGCIISLVVSFPGFYMLSTGIEWLAVFAVILMVQPMAVTYAVTGVILPRLFTADIRYSGVALGFNIAGMIGGFVPMIATSLLIAFDSSWLPIGGFLFLISAISLAGALISGVLVKTTKKLDEIV